MDGTLINTIADLANATNQALKACGFPTHNTDEYRFFVGNGINKLFERALPDGYRTAENILKIRELFIPYYNEHNTDCSRPYPGIPSLLLTLQEKGMLLAVASNKYQEATHKLIKLYFPNIEFAQIYGQREGIPSKPNSTVINEIISQTGVSRSEVAYIGDSCVDMETGMNARVSTIGVSWGFRPRTELEAYHPALIADAAEDLLKFLLLP